jgi:hypothetical protein
MVRLAHTLGFISAPLFWAGPATAFWFDWSLPASPLQLLGLGIVMILCAAVALRWLLGPAAGEGALGSNAAAPDHHTP